MTVLGSANAAVIHMLKLAVLGKSQHPRCFKGITNLPVHYYAIKKAWVNREMFTDWFNNHFVPAAQAHCRKGKLWKLGCHSGPVSRGNVLISTTGSKADATGDECLQ